MKANAPEKIYLQEPTKVRTEKKYDNDVEYVSKDSFIEKAVEWLSMHFYDEEYQSMDNEGVWICADELINDFKEYMKGE